MIRALAASLGLAAVAHSPTLTACILPTLGGLVAAEVAWVAHLAHSRRTR